MDNLFLLHILPNICPILLHTSSTPIRTIQWNQHPALNNLYQARTPLNLRTTLHHEHLHLHPMNPTKFSSLHCLHQSTGTPKMLTKELNHPSAVPQQPIIHKAPQTRSLDLQDYRNLKHPHLHTAHNLHKFPRNLSKHSMTSCRKNQHQEQPKFARIHNILPPSITPRHWKNSNSNCLHLHRTTLCNRTTYTMILTNPLMTPTKISLIPPKLPSCPTSHCL